MEDDAYDVEDGYPPDYDHDFVWRSTDHNQTDNLGAWCDRHYQWVHVQTTSSSDTDEKGRDQWLQEHRHQMSNTCDKKMEQMKTWPTTGALPKQYQRARVMQSGATFP